MATKKKITASYVILVCLGCLLFASILGGILNCIVFPIGFIIFHDCGKWICSHEYPMTWESYFIITGVLWFILSALTAVMELSSGGSNNSNVSNRTYRPYSSPRRAYNGGRETDYYDSDMEGAPGYYGGW